MLPLLKVATWQQTFMNGRAREKDGLYRTCESAHRSCIVLSSESPLCPAVERVNRKPYPYLSYPKLQPGMSWEGSHALPIGNPVRQY